mmetsp:Transcript_1121/g.2906  ORF Transcript_1121/g.2906 Transcript_1121/m.2906 type:complete len:310 (+) Transcript_1121:212-1141(+)
MPSALVRHAPMGVRELAALHRRVEAQLARQGHTDAHLGHLIRGIHAHHRACSLEGGQGHAATDVGHDQGVHGNAGVEVALRHILLPIDPIHIEVRHGRLRLGYARRVVACGDEVSGQAIGDMRRATDAADELVGAVVHLLEALQPVWCCAEYAGDHIIWDDDIGDDGVALAEQRVNDGDALSRIEAAFDVHLGNLRVVVLLHVLHHNVAGIESCVLPGRIVGVDADGDMDLAVRLEDAVVRDLAEVDGRVHQLADRVLRLGRLGEPREVVRLDDVPEDEDRRPGHTPPFDPRGHAARLGDGLRPAIVRR